ncbi:alginate export family protein [Novosphingobium decolorationis]|uniref:Alginate export family protein n=1 Tax=Novosphingobium decolorationis TaxID=2698673 RepID=A0ABX8E7G9_9SPHN|nr:alginate export family protein [Novosphingobium decolorationis]QVM84748.1 alginate export family protein [Novosphingobium decolorationis]
MRSHRKGWRVGRWAGCLTLGLVAPGLVPTVAFAADSAGSTADLPANRHETEPKAVPASTPAPAGKDPLASPFPAEADGLGPRLGPHYRLLRGAEDWRFMGREGAPDDRFAPLKAIPLDGGGDVTLSLSGGQRTSVSHSTRPLLNDTRSRTEWLSRTNLAADLRIGPAVRVYGQLVSGHIFGTNETRHVPVWENDLIVQQLFTEIRAPVASGVARITIGRQEFFDGPRFLISPRENPNIRVSMNCARLSMDWSRVRFTVFDFTPTAQGNGIFDDGIGNGETFSGGLASLLLARNRAQGTNDAIYLDPFYYHYTREQRTSGLLSGSDRRETWGARLWGHWGRVAFDWSAMKQDGRFAGRPVDAWALSTRQSVALGSGKQAPRLGFHADYASGGGSYAADGKVGAFNILYNATIIFSDDNYIGASNVMGVAPTLSVPLSRQLKVATEAGFYWRPNEDDAAYRGNAVVYAGTQNVQGRHLVNIARARIDWTPDPHVVLSGIANYVDAGKVLTRAGYGDNLFLQTRLTLRF